MKSKRTFILSSPYSLLLACFLLLWTGCTNEDIIGGENKGDDPVTVTLSLSSTPVTAGDHEWETKTNQGIVDPEANELMYSATVFVCDAQGKIVAKASIENLENKEKHTFANEVTLKTGSYTLYGFANCEYLDELKTILGQTENTVLPDAVTGNTLVINDPAGKINFKQGHYIPMTGFKQVTVDASTKTLTVSVDRLVSKAMFKITYPTGQANNEAVTIQSLVLEGNRQRVPLFPKDEYTTDKRGECDPIELIQTPIEDFSDQSESIILPALYLNESLLRNPYRLKMQVKDEENPRNGSFNRRMTRNHVRPIEIQITNIKLWVDGYYNNDPIGAVLNPVAFSHAYTLEMQEGSRFHLDLHLKSRGKDVDNTMASDIQWSHEFKGRSWQIGETSTQVTGDVSHYILDGAVPANGAGEGEAELDITVRYKDPDRPDYNRELNFTLHLKRTALDPDRPSPTKSFLRGFSWEEIIEM